MSACFQLCPTCNKKEIWTLHFADTARLEMVLSYDLDIRKVWGVEPNCTSTVRNDSCGPAGSA